MRSRSRTVGDNAQVVLVTGATSGMGRATALRVAAAGYRVVCTGRDPMRMARLRDEADRRGVQVEVRDLELTDHAAVRSVVDHVAGSYGGIDALISQAGGILALGTLEQLSMDSLRMVMETNFFGNLAMIQSALPHLRASRGRLLVTTSANGLIGAPYNDAYAASKFALEGAVESLAPVIAQFGVRTTLVEPGPVVTDALAARRVEKLPAIEPIDDDPYQDPSSLLRSITTTVEGVQTPDQVAGQIVALLEADDPPLRHLTSEWTRDYVRPKLSSDLDGRKAFAAGAAYLARAKACE